MPDLLPDLPDAARVWLYVADRTLTDHETTALEAAFARFFETWHTHRVPVRGGAAVLGRRVLVVAGARTEGDPADLSGCGIDQHAREVERAGKALGVGWMDGLAVTFRRPGTDVLEALPRADFRAGLAAGTISPGVDVLDATLPNLGAVRRGQALRPLVEGPFARWLPADVAAPSPPAP